MLGSNIELTEFRFRCLQRTKAQAWKFWWWNKAEGVRDMSPKYLWTHGSISKPWKGWKNIWETAYKKVSIVRKPQLLVMKNMAEKCNTGAHQLKGKHPLFFFESLEHGEKNSPSCTSLQWRVFFWVRKSDWETGNDNFSRIHALKHGQQIHPYSQGNQEW